MVEFALNVALGISPAGILECRQNLWVGISDTPWFRAPDNLEALIHWAAEHTRDDLLVCIPGRLYSINANHLEKKSRSAALRAGFKMEDEYRHRVEECISGDAAVKARPTHIVDYDDLLTPMFIRRRRTLYRAFSEAGAFYGRIMEVAYDYLRSRRRTRTKDRAEAVGLYQLQELPMFIAPLSRLETGAKYDTVVYPGVGKFDQLARDLVEGKVFPDLTQQLELSEPCGIASVSLKEESK